MEYGLATEWENAKFRIRNGKGKDRCVTNNGNEVGLKQETSGVECIV